MHYSSAYYATDRNIHKVSVYDWYYKQTEMLKNIYIHVKKKPTLLFYTSFIHLLPTLPYLTLPKRIAVCHQAQQRSYSQVVQSIHTYIHTYTTQPRRPCIYRRSIPPCTMLKSCNVRSTVLHILERDDRLSSWATENILAMRVGRYVENTWSCKIEWGGYAYVLHSFLPSINNFSHT